MTVRVKGLVVRSYEVSSGLHYIHILTHENGKVSAGVRGNITYRGRFGVAVMPMSYSEFVLYTSGDSYWVNEATLISSFFGLSDDYSKLTLGSYVTDVASFMSVEGQPDEALMSLTLNTLWLISSKKDLEYKKIKAVFELRAAMIGGFAPDLGGCRDCGKNICDINYISAADGCLICSECAKLRSKAVSEGFSDTLFKVSLPTVAAVNYALYSDPKKLYSFHLDSTFMEEFVNLGEGYLARQLDHRFPTLDMMDI